MLFRGENVAFFVDGFAKSDRENPRRDELATFRMLADEYLALESGEPRGSAIGRGNQCGDVQWPNSTRVRRWQQRTRRRRVLLRQD